MTVRFYEGVLYCVAQADSQDLHILPFIGIDFIEFIELIIWYFDLLMPQHYTSSVDNNNNDINSCILYDVMKLT